MYQQQRHRGGTPAFDMNIVKVDRIECDGVLAEFIKLGFLFAPVVLIAPIVNKGAKDTQGSCRTPIQD